MTFDNIDDAIHAIEKISSKIGNPVYYRGQHHDWSVTSSLHRMDSENNPDLTKEEMQKSYNFVEWLKSRRIIQSIGKLPSKIIDFPYWAIAQHYGYKTDMIDFTTDINVAKAFALLGKKPDETGCIICLWKEDVELISLLYKGYSKKFKSNCKDILDFLNFDPFLHFDIPEISRIINQKGVFMWDTNSIATQLFAGVIDHYCPNWIENHTFRFKQSDASVEIETIRVVYPSPNITEMEIDRYLQFVFRDFYYRNSVIPEMPGIERDLSIYFLENTWSISQDLFFADPLVHYPSECQETTRSFFDLVDLTNLLNNIENCKSFVVKWTNELKNNRYIVFMSRGNDSLKLFAEVINEILTTLSLYGFFDAEIIGLILYQAIRLLYTLFENCHDDNQPAFIKILKDLEQYNYNLNDSSISFEAILDSLRGSIPLDEAVREAWEHEFIFIKLLRNSGNSSVCVLPKDIINNCNEPYKKEHIKVVNDLYKKSIIPPTILLKDEHCNTNIDLQRKILDQNNFKWEDMLNIVSNPRVLFSEKDIILFSIYFFIPWQFIMSPKRSRLFNPFEIQKVKRLEADNFKTIHHIYYLGGAYYTIV